MTTAADNLNWVGLLDGLAEDRQRDVQRLMRLEARLARTYHAIGAPWDGYGFEAECEAARLALFQVAQRIARASDEQNATDLVLAYDHDRAIMRAHRVGREMLHHRG